MFKMKALSIKHLRADEEQVKAAPMDAEFGDHTRLTGLLAVYANSGNGFHRGSSTREDSGDSACETIHVHEFTIIDKANRILRRLYTIVNRLNSVGH